MALALASAGVWGSGDFSGGLAAKRGDSLHVLAVSTAAGLALLLTLTFITREPGLSLSTVGWAGGAGLAGALGVASLYRGLAIGSAALVAPTAAVITAALPVLLNMAVSGPPGLGRASGFAVAAGGIWLVASAPGPREHARAGLPLACLAGVGFGGFLFLIARVPTDSVFAPLAVARAVAFIAAVVLMQARATPWPRLTRHPFALLAGLLDAGGNVLYLLAREHIEVDAAAVLSSFYPVATVALARLVSHERVTRTQWVGAGVCIVAVVLITL